MESPRSAWLTEQGEGRWVYSSVRLLHTKWGRGAGIIAQFAWYTKLRVASSAPHLQVLVIQA